MEPEQGSGVYQKRICLGSCRFACVLCLAPHANTNGSVCIANMKQLRSEVEKAIGCGFPEWYGRSFYLIETAGLPSQKSHYEATAFKPKTLNRIPKVSSSFAVHRGKQTSNNFQTTISQEKNLVLVYGSPLETPERVRTSALQKVWYFQGYEPTQVLIIDGDSDTAFRVEQVPKAWDKNTAMAIAATAEMICEMRPLPKEVGMLIAELTYCICETGTVLARKAGYMIAKGHLCCLKKAFANQKIDFSTQNKMRVLAAYYGQLEILKYLPLAGKHLSENLIESAIRGGNLVTLCWVCKSSGEDSWNLKMCNTAALLGRLDILQWLFKAGCPYETRPVYQSAVIGGNLETIEWLYAWLSNQDFPWLQTMCPLAASYGHRAVFEWLKRHGDTSGPHDCMKACCKTGALNMLKWFHGQGNPLSEIFILFAAHCNSLQVLRWLYEKGCPRPNFGLQVYVSIAEAGSALTLKWLHKQEGPWDRDIYEAISAGGTPELRKWARSLA